jgi:hypothetical protein
MPRDTEALRVRPSIGPTIFLVSIFILMCAYQAHAASCKESIEEMINWLQTPPHKKEHERSIRSITSRLIMRHSTQAGTLGIASYSRSKMRVVDKALQSDAGYRTFFSDRGFFRHSRTKIETLAISKQSIRLFDNTAGLKIDYRAVQCFPSEGPPIFIVARPDSSIPEIMTMIFLYEEGSANAK